MDELKGITSITCTERTKKVNYEEIRRDALKMMPAKFCVAWAYKLNCHGSRLKDDDHVVVDGTQMTSTELLKKLSTQEGWAEYEARRAMGTQKLGSKNIITLSRLARAFASAVIKLLQMKIAKQSPDMLGIKAAAKDCNLPDEYCFLNAPYGMKEENIVEQADNLRKFFAQYNATIKHSIENGWIEKKEGSKARDWVAEFNNYLLFKGIKA